MLIRLDDIKQLKLIENITKELEDIKNMTEEELEELYREYYKNY